MRRASPYPCIAPIVSRDLSTLSVTVPCHTYDGFQPIQATMGRPYVHMSPTGMQKAHGRPKGKGRRAKGSARKQAGGVRLRPSQALGPWALGTGPSRAVT